MATQEFLLLVMLEETIDWLDQPNIMAAQPTYHAWSWVVQGPVLRPKYV